MKIKIAYYISSHGYGHLIRSLSLLRFLISGKINDFTEDQVDYFSIRALKKIDFDISIIINDNRHAKFIAGDKILSRIPVFARGFDVNIQEGHDFNVNIIDTVNNFRDFMHRSDSFIDTEKKFIRENNFDFIITDIGFIPAAASYLAGKPCYILGNFTWEEVFFDYFQRGYNIYKSDILYLLDCYNMADIYFQLPLALKFRLNIKLQPLGFITKRSVFMGEKIRRSLNMLQTNKYVFDTADIQGHFNIVFNADRIDKNIKFIVWNRYGNIIDDDRYFYVNEDDFDFEEVLAGCDIILGKPGYNLLAQSIIFNKRVLLLKRAGFVETDTIVSDAGRHIAVKTIEEPSAKYFISPEFGKDIDTLINTRIGIRMKPPLFGEIDFYKRILREYI